MESMNKFMKMLSEGCRRMEFYSLLLNNSGQYSETLKNKEFMKWLKDEKFDVAFPHMYSLCAVGLVRAAEIPTWVWLNR